MVRIGFFEGGAAVGPRRLYTAHGVPVGTLRGALGSERRNGIANCPDSNYVEINLGAGPYAFVGRVTTTVTWNNSLTNYQIFGRDPAFLTPTNRWALLKTGSSLRSLWLTGTGSVVSPEASFAMGPMGSPGTYYIGATGNPTTGALTLLLWDAAGTLLSSAAATAGARTMGDGNYFGRGPNPGTAVDGAWGPVVGWSSYFPSQAELQAIVDAFVAGDTLDEVYADPTLAAQYATLPTDGIITGAYDPAAPTVLYPETGSGAAVTAEYA